MITAELKVANPIEAQAGWDRVGTTPGEMALWMTRVFSIPLSGVDDLEPFIISSNPPESNDNKKKIYFNTGPLPSIGVPINNGSDYAFFYQYPPYVPMIWTAGDSKKPAYLRRLSPAELTKMSLTAPTDASYYYVILEP